MKQIQVPALEQVSSEAQALLAGVQKKMGKIPNLYATIGYSAATLKGLLEFEASLGTAHHFSGKEKEAINLIISQVNDCDYCLAAHTALAQLRGFSQEETLAIRKAAYSETKLNTVLQLAQSIATNKGKGDQALIDAFFEAGYNEAALIELIGLITVRTLTNYVFANTHIPIDFPAAPSLA